MRRLCLLPLLAIGLSACTPIPNESVELSEAIGTQITASHLAYVHLVHAYFNDKTQTLRDYTQLEIDNYINQIEQAATSRGGQHSVPDSELTTAMEHIKAMYSQMQLQILHINSIETIVLEKEEAEYNNTMRANITLSDYLRSLSDAAASMLQLIKTSKTFTPPQLPAAGPAHASTQPHASGASQHVLGDDHGNG